MDGISVPMAKIMELTRAAESGDVDRVAGLVAEGVPVDAENEQYRTALDLAVCANRVAVVRLLLSVGADPEQSVGEYHEDYPLRFVSPRGWSDMAAVLLEGGARPERRPEWRGSPMVRAATYGTVAIVEMLLDHGISIEGDDPLERSPLECAAFGGRLEIVRFLLDRGARPRVEAVAEAEDRLAQAMADPDNDDASTPERWQEYVQVIATIKDALAGEDFEEVGVELGSSQAAVSQAALSVDGDADRESWQVAEDSGQA